MSVAAQQRPPAGTLVLDHVSHFVPELAAAARALHALGFVVTPESAQATQDGPAGTSNVCVMLSQGYLEFLAPTGETANALRLHAAMRRYHGVHLACFGTPAAGDEHARLGWHGFEPPPMVELERPVLVGGAAVRARFNVVRPGPEKMPEGRIQYVEHLTPEALWQRRYLGHANGVVKLACVFVVADDTIAAAARWGRFAALLPSPAGGYVHLATGRGSVLIGSRAHWAALLGDAPPAPGLAGYALQCRDPRALVSRCKLLGLAMRRIRDNLYSVALPAELGGAWIFGTEKSLGLP